MVKKPQSDTLSERPLLSGPLRMSPAITHRFRTPTVHLGEEVTPTDGIFVLAHFGVAHVQLDTWSLVIDGMVERPCILSLDDVMAFPKKQVEAFIKCAGLPADPTIATRYVSNAIWGGASLKAVMDWAGLHREATHLWFSAPDAGTYQKWSADEYEKDLPISRLAIDDVLLAYEVNGEPLRPEHGYPLRVLVPGFYGTNSVKWLCKIVAANDRASGTFTNELYNDPVLDAVAGSDETAPVYEAPPESLIVEPVANAVVKPGTVKVAGWCWGNRAISHVDVSVDEGVKWLRVNAGSRRDYSWQRFECFIDLPTNTRVRVWARATDVDGKTQPLRDARNSVHEVCIRTAGKE